MTVLDCSHRGLWRGGGGDRRLVSIWFVRAVAGLIADGGAGPDPAGAVPGGVGGGLAATRPW